MMIVFNQKNVKQLGGPIGDGLAYAWMSAKAPTPATVGTLDDYAHLGYSRETFASGSPNIGGM